MHELRGSLGTVHRNRGGGASGRYKVLSTEGTLGPLRLAVRSGGRDDPCGVQLTIVVTGRVFEAVGVLNSCDV